MNAKYQAERDRRIEEIKAAGFKFIVTGPCAAAWPMIVSKHKTREAAVNSARRCRYEGFDVVDI
jgi:hypothetical protein